MKGKSLIKGKSLLIVSIVLGLAAALAVQFYLVRLSRDSQVLNMGKVVVARQDLPAHTVLTLEMLERVDYPADYLPTGSTSDPKTAVNMVTLSPILKGEPVLRGHLAGVDSSEHGLAFRVTAGKRAVTLAVDEVTGINGMLIPGDRVDVFGTIDLPDPSNPAADKNVPAAVVSVYDVEVLAIGDKQVKTNTEVKAKTEGTKTVTLAVPVGEAQRLILLADKGKARLVLRSPADHDRPALPPFTLRNYL